MTRAALAFLLISVAAQAQQPAPRDSSAPRIVLALPELVTTALRRNVDLRVAEVGPRTATAELLAARAAFDPSLIVGSELGREANDVLGVRPRTTQATTAHSATLGTVLPAGSQFALTLQNSRVSLSPFAFNSTLPFPVSHATGLSLAFTQPLLRGFGRAGNYGFVEGAAFSVEAAQNRYDRAADRTVAAVERAYWILRQSEAVEVVLAQSVEASKAIWERNVALQARDVATALDVLTSERGYATRQTQLWDATRQRIDAAEQLLFLVHGEEARGPVLLQAPRVRTTADSMAVPPVPSFDEAEALAMSRRGDVRAAEREVDADQRRVEQSRNQLRPRLDLTAAYGYGGQAQTLRFFQFPDSADVRNSNWSLGLTAAFFQKNHAARAQHERAESALEVSRLSRVATDNAVRGETRAAVRAVETARERFLRAGDVGRLAEREYAAAREGARLGLITTFQLLQYEEQLAQARLLVAQARFALELAGTEYRLAIGDSRAGYRLR